MAIGEHISTNEQIQIELDSKEDALAAAQDQIEVLTKELCDTGAQSEEVVIKWQGTLEPTTFQFSCIKQFSNQRLKRK